MKVKMRLEKQTNRRDVILCLAERHFSQHGYQGASLSAIARDAKIGNSGLLHHFPSKAKLYKAVLERLAEDVVQKLEKNLEGCVEPEERVRVFVESQTVWLVQRPDGLRVIQRELLDNAERIKSASALPLRGYLLMTLELIKEAQEAGKIRDDLSAIAILCCILGSLSYAASVRPTFLEAFEDEASDLSTPQSWSELIGDSILRLIAKPPSSGLGVSR